MSLYMVNIVLSGSEPWYDLHDREEWVFTSEEKAKRFLLENGFVYGRREFCTYEGDEAEWFHRDESRQMLIGRQQYLLTATITEIEVDAEAESRFKYFMMDDIDDTLRGKKEEVEVEPPFSFEEEDKALDIPAAEGNMDPDDEPFTGCEGNSPVPIWIDLGDDEEEDYEDEENKPFDW